MALNLSIKNVPNEVVDRLRSRAKRHHRSLQGELLAILEETVSDNKLSVNDAYDRARALSLKMASESTLMIREDRDAR